MNESKLPIYFDQVEILLREGDFLSELDWMILRWLLETGETLNEKPVILILIILFLAVHEGSLCVNLYGKGFKKKFEDLMSSLPEEDRMEEEACRNLFFHWTRTEASSKILSRSGEFKPLILQDSRLYFQKYFQQENQLKTALDRLKEEKTFPVCFSKKDLPAALNKKQQEAVQNALKHGISVISGGPGTGKTFTLQSVLEQLLRQGIPGNTIALAAPTGKAAGRMEEVLKNLIKTHALSKPSTVHRLLKYQPLKNTFTYGPFRSLPFQVVILDEVSMVGVELMNNFLSALRPGTRLILTGDQNQLPSVEAGAVLSWLVLDTLKDRTVILNESYRSHGLAYLLAQKVNLCLPQDAPSLSLEFPEAQALFSQKDLGSLKESENCRWINEETHLLVPLLKNWAILHLEPIFRSGLPPEKQLQALEKFKILCYQRRGKNGTLKVNHLLSEILKSNFKDAPPPEPILITENNYDLNLFNGDTGISQKGSAFFPGDRKFPLALVGTHETAYAMTVHKSQGSEYDHVLILLPETETPFLTRELLYTAITRAKKSVTLYGKKEILAFSIAGKIIRESGLNNE